MSETMIERVAKEMAAREGWRWDENSQMIDRCGSGISNTSRERDVWRFRARAAIEAIRVPTEEMNEAGRNNNYRLYATAAWEAMIDAALKEPKP